MAKWTAEISFVANVEIEAPDEYAAEAKARDILDGHSVYEDDKLDEMHDEAYYAGAAGSDPPLRKKKAYMLRNMDFEPSPEIIIGEMQ